MASSPRKRLLIRIDDAGVNLDTNRGVEAAALSGIARSVGIMACTPEFDDAVRRLRALPPSVAIGVHLTLNSEWTNLRWGPVLPVSAVPSLVDDTGFFPPNHQFYRDHPPVIAELVAELRAQIARVRGAGLKPCYADEHMVFAGVFPFLAQPIRELVTAEGLLYARDAALLRLEIDAFPTSFVTAWPQAMQRSAPGDYLVVTHPAADGADIHALTLPGKPAGTAAPQRIAEHAALLNPALSRNFAEAGVSLISYADLSA